MPSSGFNFDASGNLYGETLYDGSGPNYCLPGYGLAYALSPGGGWYENVFYDFGEGAVSEYPDGGFVMDPGGNFYGVGSPPGTGGDVFELINSGTGWIGNLIHTFSGSVGPVGPLARDADGNLYARSKSFVL